MLLQTQAHAPVNLITETYDHLEICKHKDLESFVDSVVKMTMLANQINECLLSIMMSKWLGLSHSTPPMRLCLLFRYQGVKLTDGRWSVYIHGLKYACINVSLGWYVDEKKAASAYDRARIF